MCEEFARREGRQPRIMIAKMGGTEDCGHACLIEVVVVLRGNHTAGGYHDVVAYSDFVFNTIAWQSPNFWLCSRLIRIFAGKYNIANGNKR